MGSQLAALLEDGPLPPGMEPPPPMIEPPPRFCGNGGGLPPLFPGPIFDGASSGTGGVGAPVPAFPTAPPTPPMEAEGSGEIDLPSDPFPGDGDADMGLPDGPLPGDGDGDGDGDLPDEPFPGADGGVGFPDDPFPGDGDGDGFPDDDFPGGETDGGIGFPGDGDGDFPDEPFPGQGDCSREPLGFWRFDDCNTGRTELFDSGNEGHTAFRNVVLACDEGLEGLSPDFARSSDMVYSPDQPAFVLDQGVTVAAWVRPEHTRGVQTIFRKRDAGTSAFALVVRGDRYMFVVRLASGEMAYVAAPATEGEWTHVAATYDNAYLRLYIGGAEVDSAYAPGVLANGVGPLLMGNDGLDRRLQGTMDNAWFNNLAAPADKILELTCVRQPASISVDPVSGPEVPGGTPVTYTVSLTNNDSPVCEPTQLIGFASVPQDFTVSPNFFPTPSFGPGEVLEVPFEVTSSEEAEPDTYDLQFSFFSFLGGFGAPLSVSAQYTVVPPSGCHVRSSRALTIRDVSVVDDPIRTSMVGPPGDPRVGAWAFGRLMERLSPTAADAPNVTEGMFASFAVPQEVNGFFTDARPAIEPFVLSPWPRNGDGELDLSQAPLRLLAIVNRLDLKDLANGKGGELRLVYGMLGPGGFPMEFTVILEYMIPAQTEEEYAAWVEAFHALQELPFPSEEYNAALQALTDAVTATDALPGAVNDSALIDIRTNEIELSFQWELREFRLSPTTGLLEPFPVFQTPDASFNFTPVLADFINENESSILAETHDAPLQFAGMPFKGASVFNNIDVWSAPGINNPEARHKFSLNTCNGCHGGETNTAFLHITPREEGQRSQLSAFLTGTTVFDFETGEPRRLAELARRRALLEAVVCDDSDAP